MNRPKHIGRDPYKIANLSVKTLHPLLLACYSVLTMYAFNIHTLLLDNIARSLVSVLLVTAVLLAILALSFGDAVRAAFLTTILVFLFFSYGHIYLALQEWRPLHESLPPYGWHWVMLPLWFVLLVGGVLVALRQDEKLGPVNRYLALVNSLLFLMVSVNIVAYEVFERPNYNPAWQVLDADAIETTFSEPLPDIYYIILDEYTANSTLLDIYGYDNRPYTDALEARGFYVAYGSRANYAHTMLSLSSSLNMQYLDSMAAELDPEDPDITPTFHLIDDNVVARILRDAGYRFVHVPSYWGATERNPIADEDVYLAGMLTDTEIFFGFLTWLNPAMPTIYYGNVARARTLFAFDALSRLPDRDDGPAFVFAHLMVPHVPYVFATGDAPLPADGQPVEGVIVDERAYDPYAKYLQQIGFTNRMVVRMIDDILAASETPPIIIVQSDHGNRVTGWGREEYDSFVMPIQNAYYLPRGGAESLYRCITPVNTFRVILNTYLGADLELLPDKEYFSSLETPYHFVELPARCDPAS